MFKSVETVVNRTAEPIEVFFEPWGGSHSLPPGQSFRIIATSKHDGQLEVDAENGVIAVYAWLGATMQIYQDDELIEDLHIAVPDMLPPGLSVRSFIDLMFGGPGGPAQS